MAAKNTDDFGDLLGQEELDDALEAFTAEADPKDVAELLKSMNENSIITWEEAERIMAEGPTGVVQSGLPQQMKPTDPDNETDIEDCVARLINDDPSLIEINLNNMKRTPIPNVQKLILAVKDSSHIKKLSLANLALTDTAAEPLIETIGENSSLTVLNIETNFLSGDFIARLLKAALQNQTLVELRAANQGPTFSNTAEMDIMRAIILNESICKFGLTFRSQEARVKVDQAIFRNCEIKRMNRLKEKNS